ncbi:MAG TPA: ring-cleaving dioxygenase [Opitutaceae bacterium]|nr:ring-cleaving dioxygenase [Opitutaceae bacterium]
MQLAGFHHLTAVTADAPRNYAFYTDTLGLRLVKKTVNQDDVSAYHLFYADAKGSPGTDITFFDWPAAREQRGTHCVARTGFRLASEASLAWWAQRFAERGVTAGKTVARDGKPTLDFEDFEGQRLALVVDGARGAANVWEKSPVPAEHQILGLGPITLSVPDLRATDVVLTQVMNLRRVREYALPGGTGAEPAKNDGAKAADATVHVYQMGADGAAGELHVAVEPGMRPARQGAGGVHHVAFRTPNVEEYNAWAERLEKLGMHSSGPVNRYYFRSLYFREPNGVLFEIATDGPGFAADESAETLGERLALPPFLEPRRREIEAGLKPLATDSYSSRRA